MTVTINGVTLAYSDQGQGKPIVFLHAFPVNRTMWEPQMNALSHTYRTISIDLRGHGESDAPLWRSTMKQFADDVIGVLDHLSITQATFVWLSMGGYVLFALYRNYPERVAGLVLADTRAQADTEDTKAGRMAMAQVAYHQGAEAIAELMLPKLFSPATLATKADLIQTVRCLITSTKVSGMVSDLMAMADRPDATDMLATITCPTLIIVGQDDVATSPSESQFMADRIPHAHVEMIPDAGHLSNMEQPEAFTDIVKSFLKKL